MRGFYWSYAGGSSAACAKILKRLRESSQMLMRE
jgi:hypothetical protein